MTEIQEERKREIARGLLEIGAVFLRPAQPFTWASGIQSPIYCDNRLILSAPDLRGQVERGLAACIQEHFPEAEILEGTATAGIAHAALTADLLQLPMGYVRGSNKDHGRQNRIEGKLEPGQKAVIVEDLVSTGGSLLQVAEALTCAGADLLGAVAIFSYGMERSRKALAQAGLPLVTLTDFDTIIAVALDEGKIQANEREALLAFRDQPDGNWQSLL